MSYSVRDILSWQPLTAAVQFIKSGIPNVLPKEFFTLEEKVSGNQARTVEVRGTRRTARVVSYGSPALTAEKVELSDRALVLLSAREQIPFREELVFILRNWEEYTPQHKFAMKEIAFQGEQMRVRFDNLEIASVCQTLANGAIYFDSEGNMLPNATGATLIVDQGVPNSNKGQGQDINGNPLINDSWGSPNADITGMVTNIKRTAVQRSGYQLKYAIYGRNIASYMASNDQLKYFWARDQGRNAEFLSRNEVPKNFLGLTWLPAYESFYEDASGNIHELFPPDVVVFTPEITQETWAFYRGSELVPQSFGPLEDGIAALNSTKEVFGRGRYARIVDNPIQIIDVAFSHFLPRMKTPLAYFILDVTP